VNYIPQIDDYVQWKTHEGWIYFKDDQYITIEIGTSNKKDIENGSHHKKNHTLLVCHYWYWKDLKYIKNRRENYDSPKNAIKNMENKIKKS